MGKTVLVARAVGPAKASSEFLPVLNDVIVSSLRSIAHLSASACKLLTPPRVSLLGYLPQRRGLVGALERTRQPDAPRAPLPLPLFLPLGAPNARARVTRRPLVPGDSEHHP